MKNWSECFNPRKYRRFWFAKTAQEGIRRKCLLRCVLGLVGLQCRWAFASGLGTAGRGKKLVVKFSCCRKDCKEVFVCWCFWFTSANVSLCISWLGEIIGHNYPAVRTGSSNTRFFFCRGHLPQTSARSKQYLPVNFVRLAFIRQNFHESWCRKLPAI